MRELTAHKANGLNEAIKILVVDEKGAGGANHIYELSLNAGSARLCRIEFQNGPIKEAGFNGISNEALLAVVADRLECFQAGPFACDDNADALGMIKGALTCLLKRTKKRLEQGVEGTNQQHVEPPPAPKKYLWTTTGGDDQHGVFDTLELALADAADEAKELKQSIPVSVFDCRPATEADRAGFEGDPDNEIDFTKPDWIADKWVPDNLVRSCVVEPPAAA